MLEADAAFHYLCHIYAERHDAMPAARRFRLVYAEGFRHLLSAFFCRRRCTRHAPPLCRCQRQLVYAGRAITLSPFSLRYAAD